MGLDRNEAPYISIPLNNIIELTPHAYGCHEKRFCLMRKEEMLSDGQDEPITSMPVKLDNEGLPATSSSASIADQSVPYKHSVSLNEASGQYEANDPIMNAPSC